MVFTHPDVTKAAIVCELQYDSSTGIGKVLHPDGFEISKDVTIYCTTVEEFTILKHLGFNVRLNEHPSDATLHGVEGAEAVKQIGVTDVAPTVE